MTPFDEYVRDPENPLTCCSVAFWYETQGHLGPALSFWLRAAEFSDDDLLSYNALLKGALCYEKQQGRGNSVKVMIQNAMNLMPDRPEAYYLLARHYERNAQWQDCYTTATLGINVASKNFTNLLYDVEYSGDRPLYLLYFEKAVAAWWWGRNQESRELFRWIADVYWDYMDTVHQDSVEDNLCRLGSGPLSQAFIPFAPERHRELRHSFQGSEKVHENHSQIMQDVFVLMATDGKRNGTFVEIGAADPFIGNNTALLEKEFGWNGISLEYNEKFIESYKNKRSAKIYHADALQQDYRELFKENFNTTDIDYLQLDIEPARKTHQCLEMIPFDEYRFAVITFEHDYYVDPTREVRDKSRSFLESKGYVLVANDLSPDGKSNFEDWWVHPDLIDRGIINQLKLVNDEIKQVEDYIYGGKEEELSPVNFNVNPRARNSAWVVDNFYEDPDAVREFALKQEYHQGGRGRGYIGRRTFQQFLFPGLKERFEEIMGKKITRWEEHGMNGRFQTCWAGDELVYHCDEQTWAGMIYLTPEAPYQCGTTLHAHKKTRIRHSSHPEIMSVFEGENFDGTLYEPVDVLGNVYNRLVIFDAHCLHSASEYFGYNAETGRLWQMFFFD